MKYEIVPNDVLSFRDGRPFGSSDDHSIKLAFPPSLTTVYGALRTAVIGAEIKNFGQMDDLSKAALDVAGNADNFGSLTINDFGFSLDGKRIFKTPSDILKKKDSANIDEYTVLQPKKVNADEALNLPVNIEYILQPGNAKSDFFESAEEFITEEGFSQYLKGQALKREFFIERTKYYDTEKRTGIKINKDRKTVEEGCLFSIEFARLKDKCSFLIETSDKILLNQIKLGGEGRSANINASDFNSLFPSLDKIKFLKVVLLTPLFLEKGWYPDSDVIRKIEERVGCKMKFLTASINRYKSIGGWEIQANKSKPMRRFIQEGSVFYFELENLSEINNNIIFNLSTDDNDIKQGFGLAILGGN